MDGTTCNQPTQKRVYDPRFLMQYEASQPATPLKDGEQLDAFLAFCKEHNISQESPLRPALLERWASTPEGTLKEWLNSCNLSKPEEMLKKLEERIPLQK